MSAALPFAHVPHPAPTAEAVRSGLVADPGFGKIFSDHMVTIEWTEGQGWHSATLGPRQPIALDPAAAVLHYAQEIFEGLKAYRLADGTMALFRPEANARRFNASAQRLAMPELPEDLFIEAIRQLVAVDADWFPTVEGGSLYLRPFMIATEAFLGVRPAKEYKFIVIASRPAITSSRALPRFRSGCRTIPARPPAGPAQRSAAAIMPPAWSRPPRPLPRATIRCCSWMPPNTGGLRNWAA